MADGELSAGSGYGPCVICGDTNYSLSCGGPSICPKCDCGNFDAATVMKQAKVIADLREQLSAPAQGAPDWWRWRFKTGQGHWSKWIALHDQYEMEAFRNLMADNLACGSHELQALYAAQPPAAPVETETRFHTDKDREYAVGLLEDLNEEPPETWSAIATQWFCKARVETARRVAKQHTQCSAEIVTPQNEAELEAVLNSEDTRPCTVLPDGKVVYQDDTCECPKCGRMHRSLGFGKPPSHIRDVPQTAPVLPPRREIQNLIDDFIVPDDDTERAFASHRRSWVVQCLQAALSLTRSEVK